MKPEAKEEITNGFAHVLIVELLYKTKPVIRKPALLANLRELLPDIAPLDGKENSEICMFMHPKHTVKYDAGDIPAQCVITTNNLPDPKRYTSAAQQSWSFRECDAVLRECKHTVFISDLMASRLDYKIRLELFQKVVLATIKTAPPEAIHWQASQQFIKPADYMKQFEEPDATVALSAAINVRFFRISNKTEGDMIADTLGLGALGLDDLQCHFRGLEPNDVVDVLYNTACYLYEEGPVIESGHTIQGITPAQKWKCQAEESLLEPKRIVLDVNPGAANAAGKRD